MKIRSILALGVAAAAALLGMLLLVRVPEAEAARAGGSASDKGSNQHSARSSLHIGLTVANAVARAQRRPVITGAEAAPASASAWA